MRWWRANHPATTRRAVAFVPGRHSSALVVISSFFLQSQAEFLRAQSNRRAFRTWLVVAKWRQRGCFQM
jgi:hypothetical protein